MTPAALASLALAAAAVIAGFDAVTCELPMFAALTFALLALRNGR